MAIGVTIDMYLWCTSACTIENEPPTVTIFPREHFNEELSPLPLFLSLSLSVLTNLSGATSTLKYKCSASANPVEYSADECAVAEPRLHLDWALSPVQRTPTLHEQRGERLPSSRERMPRTRVRVSPRPFFFFIFSVLLSFFYFFFSFRGKKSRCGP